MSFPRYQTYGDSCVEWLRDVPEQWDVWKLAHAFAVIGSGTTPKTDNRDYYDDGDVPWINTGDLNDGELEDCAKRITSRALADHSSLKLYPAGSLLIAMYGATIGKLAILRFPATVNQACCAFAGASPIMSKFMFYWFLGLRQQILSLASGGGQPNVSQDILRALRVACPDAAEQRTIVNFLDRETSKIDALVAEQERLIELLKEKRQAVISHAVTKGLNSLTPMKPSGVEWLGDVPAAWSVTPLKYVASVGNGSTPSRERSDYWSGGTFPWLNSSVVNSDPVEAPEQFVTDTALRECHLPVVEPPAVLIGLTGQGKTRGMAARLLFRATVNQHLAFVRPRLEVVDPSFLHLFMQMVYPYIRLDSDSSGSTKGAITCEQLGQLKVTAPPLSEQREIVAHLTGIAADLDRLAAEAKRAVTLLDERRSTVISAAVTGQIDVRGLVSPEAA